MLRLTSRITIGEYTFNNCVEVEVNSGWEDMTDTCTITIPRKVKWQDKDLAAGDSPALAVGNPVTVELGYDFNYSTYFEGYITNIDVKTPVTIQCQDAFWYLKRVNCGKHLQLGTPATRIEGAKGFTMGRGTTVKQVLEVIEDIYLSSTLYRTDRATINFIPYGTSIEVGSIRAENVSLAFIFEGLKKSGVVTFMRGNNLYCGLPYYDDQRNIVERQFDWNITEDSMEQKRAEDTKIKMVVKTLDNKNLAPVEVGDGDGSTVTFLTSGVTSQTEMRERGERELTKYKYDGWKGSFTTFGDIFIKHGDVVTLTDKVIKDRNGSFFVKKVTTKFGINGFRNEVELHKKYIPVS